MYFFVLDGRRGLSVLVIPARCLAAESAVCNSRGVSSNVRHRSQPVTVATPRGKVEVIRQQWRSQRRDSEWEWVWAARRAGQLEWRTGASAREAVRQATL